MKHKKSYRQLLMVLLAIWLSGYLLLTVVNAKHLNHHCSDYRCSICLQLSDWKLMKKRIAFGTGLSGWSVLLAIVIGILTGSLSGGQIRATLVSQKVRINR